MTGLMAAVIFLIRGYVRIRKGQLKKAAQELPAGSMPLADMEAWRSRRSSMSQSPFIFSGL